MKLRINKLISDAGLGSRRDVEEYIRRGRVKINGRVAHLGDLVSEEDVVFFDEVDLPVKELIRDHVAEEKLQARQRQEAERPRSKSRQAERAESQRQQAAPKARSEGWYDEEQEADEQLVRHRNSGRRGSARSTQTPPRQRGRKRNNWEE